ncbi:hypothetical protein [Amycolatopsis sp. Poz14]|uniref:hypothetical protein n=1 Tax=Amycolatopsis sp. Poz14 TaxID=1447705 RepID=UPI001EE86DD5|nr:hypothetical protein [Amycolatopsis sp. Poz14]MCG3755050.1 hypothetical protein [Amycolatopsis sp. Poz14]
MPPADAESAGSQVATILTCAWTDGSQALARTVGLGLPDLHAVVQRAGDPVGLRRFAWSRQVCGMDGSLVLRRQVCGAGGSLVLRRQVCGAGGSFVLRRQVVRGARCGADGGLVLRRQVVPGVLHGADGGLVLQWQFVPGGAVRRRRVIGRWSARVEDPAARSRARR